MLRRTLLMLLGALVAGSAAAQQRTSPQRQGAVIQSGEPSPFDRTRQSEPRVPPLAKASSTPAGQSAAAAAPAPAPEADPAVPQALSLRLLGIDESSAFVWLSGGGIDSRFMVAHGEEVILGDMKFLVEIKARGSSSWSLILLNPKTKKPVRQFWPESGAQTLAGPTKAR